MRKQGVRVLVAAGAVVALAGCATSVESAPVNETRFAAGVGSGTDQADQTALEPGTFLNKPATGDSKAAAYLDDFLPPPAGFAKATLKQTPWGQDGLHYLANVTYGPAGDAVPTVAQVKDYIRVAMTRKGFANDRDDPLYYMWSGRQSAAQPKDNRVVFVISSQTLSDGRSRLTLSYDFLVPLG